MWCVSLPLLYYACAHVHVPVPFCVCMCACVHLHVLGEYLYTKPQLQPLAFTHSVLHCPVKYTSFHISILAVTVSDMSIKLSTPPISLQVAVLFLWTCSVLCTQSKACLWNRCRLQACSDSHPSLTTELTLSLWAISTVRSLVFS